MKKFINSASAFVLLTAISSPVFAADVYSSKDSPSVGKMEFFESKTGLVKWSGPFVGIHGGYAWGNATTTDDIADWCGPTDSACIAKYVGPFGYDADGFFGGLNAGYNVTLGNILLGVEVDAGYMDLSGERKISSSSASPHYQTLEVEGGLYGVAAGRLGVFFDRILIYGKGGFALFDGEATQTTTKTGFTTHGTDTFTGWAAGGGVEYALTSSLSVKVEYLHFDFGSEEGGQVRDSDGYNFNNETDLEVDTVKAGLNYRF